MVLVSSFNSSPIHNPVLVIFGYCLVSGEPIGLLRLNARPIATLCIEEQEKRERRERNYAKRD